MNADFINGIITLAAAIGQLGVAVAAFKLANALKARVDNHEGRIYRLEAR